MFSQERVVLKGAQFIHWDQDVEKQQITKLRVLLLCVKI